METAIDNYTRYASNKQMKDQRIIGRYTGEEKGPLLICFGGMHGNEPAGIKALDLMFKMLEVEPITNPVFKFRGRLLGLHGNLRAIQVGKRFINRDLNRQWTVENVRRIKQSTLEQLDEEDLEIKEILEIIEGEIEAYQPKKMVVLDLHSTTAYGGIFTIPTEDPESLRIAVELHAPVIKGLLRGVRGTSLHYFCNDNFEPETVALCFESGQHQEELSVNRAIAALTNCMRTIGCVKAEHVENRHDSLLIEYSRGLPKIAELITIHSIQPDDDFRMQPGYKNFQKVTKGEWLASDQKGQIYASENGLLLMPLYQRQGDDGFFLIRSLIDF
ncbi:MAG: succinylglutamate desuccinylase/aspartoacylase family protein [Bacteroidota bacterium]